MKKITHPDPVDQAFLRALSTEPNWDYVRHIDTRFAQTLAPRLQADYDPDRFPFNWFEDEQDEPSSSQQRRPA